MSSLLSQPAFSQEPDLPPPPVVEGRSWSRRRVAYGLLGLWVLSGIFLVQPELRP